jgi:flagellar assembly protein FliH
MTGARRFQFDRDFRAGVVSSEQAAAAKAEESGYARGLADGQRLAADAAATRMAQACEKLVGLAQGLLSREAERIAVAESEAAQFALLFASKIAGDALARFPLNLLEEAARDCFRQLRGVPHLVVRINEALVDDANAVMQRVAHENGFSGKIVVLGEPDIGPGDVRLEWADGGIVRDRAALEATIAAVVARTLEQTDH